MFGLSFTVNQQPEFSASFLYRFHQPPRRRTRQRRPTRDLVDNRLPVLLQESGRRVGLLTLFRSVEYRSQIAVLSYFQQRDLLRRAVIKLRHCHFHVAHSDVRTAALAHWIDIPHFPRDAVHVAKLRHRTPAPVLLFPARTRRHPYRESFSKILIRMFLRVPPGQVTHVVFRKQYRPVIFSIWTP